MARNSAVANETLAYCTSCKMDLNHIIVAVKGDRIAKVQCLTCKKEHVYRVPKGVIEPSTKPKAPRKSSKSSDAGEGGIHSIEVEWEKLMSAHREAPIKPYTIKGQFGLGDKLNHPTFGDGIVGRLIYPNKLEVIFRTDVKVLIYAGLQQQQT
jgi:hypothetical protein